MELNQLENELKKKKPGLFGKLALWNRTGGNFVIVYINLYSFPLVAQGTRVLLHNLTDATTFTLTYRIYKEKSCISSKTPVENISTCQM